MCISSVIEPALCTHTDLRIHPYFQHNIKHVNVGDELVVYCRQYGASSSDGGSFQWIPSLEGDERVSSEEEDFLAGYQSILRINGVAREHHNTYTCTYRNENGQIDSASVSFDLIVLGKNCLKYTVLAQCSKHIIIMAARA